MTDILSSMAYLNGKPTVSAKLKVKPEHFIVVEQLGFDFSGVGEHLMVRIRKTGENTSFVANELAKACGVKSKDVSWAGLKDRHAVTEQWFSIHLPQAITPDFSEFLAQYPHIEILATTRHHKKLRPGEHIGNDFVITLSEVSDVAAVEPRLNQIIKQGVPNYFGEQRFGNDGNNLKEARRWGKENVRTRNQNQRSLYLSTARSWIFNLIVSARINQGKFAQVIEGDLIRIDAGNAEKDGNLMMSNGENQEWLQKLVAAHQAQITAALAGDNALPTQALALALEQPHLDAEPDLMALIRGNRMRHDRRAIALIPQNLSWESKDREITLTFSLDAGSFATAIIRELVNVIAVERHY